MMHIVRQALAVLAALILLVPSASRAETVLVGGTGVADEFLRRAAAAFTPKTGIQIELAQNLGSPGALHALADGSIDLAVSAQLPNEKQKAKGLRVVFTKSTPFVWATSHPTPQSLTSADIVKAYREGHTWSDGSPVRVILRAKQSPDTAFVEEYWPALASVWETARKRPDIPIAGNDPDNAEKAERVPGSLTAITLLQIKAEKRNLHPITLDGVAPTLENFERGLYKYAKPLAFVVPESIKPGTQRFIDFLRSAEGESIFRQASGYTGS